MKRAARSALVLTALALSCKSLPDVPANQCGNGVVEPELGEHCDGAATVKGPNGEATVCGAPGNDGACRYVPTAEGVCPIGYRVTRDGVCREPSGRFARLASLDATVTGVVPIDLGGDGKLELGVNGLLSISFYDFADGQARVLGTVPANVPVNLAPTVADISGDGLDDLVLPTRDGFSGYLGQVDGSLDPLVSSNIRPGTKDFRVFNVQITPDAEDLELLAVLRVDDMNKAYFSAGGSEFPPGGFAVESAQPFIGMAVGRVDVSGNACEELIIHDFTDPDGAAAVVTIDTCPVPNNPDREHRLIIPLPESGLRLIRPTSDNGAPAPIDAGFHQLDVDGDGVRDLVVQAARGEGASCQSSLFFLRGGATDEGFLPLAAPALEGAGEIRCNAPVRALGFFDRDAELDAVVGDSLLLSKLESKIEIGTGPVLAADFSGDGVADLAVGFPFSGLVTFIGGNDVLLTNFYETRGEVRYLDVADLDGDRVGDLVLGELNVASFQSTPCTSRSYAEILYGRRFTLPETPTFVGNVPDIVQLFAGRLSEDEADAFGDVALVSSCDGVSSGAVVEGDVSRTTLSQFRLQPPHLEKNESMSLAGLSIGDIFLGAPGTALSPGQDGLPDVLAYATIATQPDDAGTGDEIAPITGVAVWGLPGLGQGTFGSGPPLKAQVDFLQSFETNQLEASASSILSTVGTTSQRLFVWISGRACTEEGCTGRWETFYADPATAASSAKVTALAGEAQSSGSASLGKLRLAEVVTRDGGSPEIFVADPTWGIYRIHDELGALGVEGLDALAPDGAAPMRDFAVIDAGVPRTLLVNDRALFLFDPDANTVTEVPGFDATSETGARLVHGDFDGDGLDDLAVVSFTRVEVFRQLSTDEESRDVVLSLAPTE